jgi:nucleotide-binding universal stress UspA family protein
MIAPRNILVATDFGEAAETALAYGRALAHTFGASLHLLHVKENTFFRPIAGDPHPSYEAALRNVNQRLTDDDNRLLRAEAVVEISDDPADAIVQYARTADIDLIVTGTHGRTGVEHALIGSVAERVVRTTPCPVLTVRHPEREFVLPDDHRTAEDRRKNPQDWPPASSASEVVMP